MREIYQPGEKLQIVDRVVPIEWALFNMERQVPQVLQFSFAFQRHAGEILGLDDRDPRLWAQEEPEAWGIICYSPRHARWEKLIARKGINPNYSPLQPPRGSPERKRLRTALLPIHVHTHLDETDLNILDRLSIRIQRWREFPFVGWMAVNKSKSASFYVRKWGLTYQGYLNNGLTLIK